MTVGDLEKGIRPYRIGEKFEVIGLGKTSKSTRWLRIGDIVSVRFTDDDGDISFSVKGRNTGYYLQDSVEIRRIEEFEEVKRMEEMYGDSKCMKQQ